MADGKITLYGELESGVPGGKIVDYTLVANTPDVYSKEEIDNMFENTSSGGGGSYDVDLSNYYTKTDTDNKLNEKLNKSDIADWAKKANKPTYTITEITNLETALSGKVDNDDLSAVATSGSYSDLEGKPTIPDISELASETYVDTKVAELSASANATFATKQELNSKADKDDIPSVEGLATTIEVANALTSAQAYTDKEIEEIDIPEYSNGNYITITDHTIDVNTSSLESYFNDIYDKVGTAAKVQSDLEDELANYTNTEDLNSLLFDKLDIIKVSDINITSMGGYMLSENNTRYYIINNSNINYGLVIDNNLSNILLYIELVITLGNTRPEITLPQIKWVKPIEFIENSTHYIVIERIKNVTMGMWTAVSNN